MATKSSASASSKKRKAGRIIAVIFAIFIIPIVVGYFVLTSDTFFKRVILPKVGASIHSSVTVSDVSISPFSQVVLKNLEVKPFEKETLFKADEVRARYSLWNIIKGRITVHEATLVSPIITIVEAADGSSNLDAITKEEAPSPEDKKDTKSEDALNLDVKNISLKNALVRHTKVLEGNGRETTEIANLNFTLDQLINGQSGKMKVAADVRMARNPSANATNGAPGSLQGKLEGSFDYKLTPTAQPEFAKGNLRFDVLEATGEMSDLSKLAAVVNCDFSPTEIRQLSLNFEQAGQPLGELSATGPFSFATTEGKLNVKLSSIDRRVLNLVGAPKGFDFNSTVINANNDLVFAQNGNSIAVTGEISAKQLSITETETKQTTPTLNFQTTYQMTVDQGSQSALIQKFSLNGTQNEQQILRGSISRPMPISWGGTAGAPEDAAFHLAITNLNLADWKSFAGETAPSGTLHANIEVHSQRAGKQLSVNLTSRLDSLTAKFGSNQISNADVELKTKATIAEMKTVSLSEYNVQLTQNDVPALALSGSGTFDLESNDADMKLSMNGTLARLFRIVVMPDSTASAGALKFEGQITQRKDSQMVKGNLAVAGFSGTYAGTPLDRFGATFDLDLEVGGQDLKIRKASGALQQAGQPGGTFDVSGKYNSEMKTGNLEMKMADLNQNALRPFLAETLGEKQLVTISVNANTTLFLQEKSSSIRGSVEINNFVVRDTKTKTTDATLSAQLQLDATKRDEVFDLKQFQITLSPTERAKNQLNITGQLDLSKTNAANGQLLVQSDSFDVTPFYNLYNPPDEKAAATAATTTPAEPSSNAEPEPVNLPVERILAEINIGQFYLREMEIKNWRGTAKIEGSRILLNPFQLTLNNAPVRVNADVNLGVKGYAYDFSAALNGVPLEPLANSFMPEKRGAYKGMIIADAKIKGAGTTGVSLKKSLAGNAHFTFTNANIQIVGPKVRQVLVPIATALRISEIAESPVNWIDAKVEMGDGKINVSSFNAESEAFRANLQTTIPIANVLTNSPLNNVPVNFQLRRSLAEKAPKEMNLRSGTPSADGKYVALPTFVRMGGTLGDPKPKIDLTPLLIRAGIGAIGGDAGKILGGILGQPSSSVTNTNATNSISTNAPAEAAPLNQLLEGLLNRSKKK